MASAIEDIIDELEEYIDSCKPSSIFNDTKIVVNRDDIEGLLAELRNKTPEEIRRYQKIISNKEAILADCSGGSDYHKRVGFRTSDYAAGICAGK